MKFEIYLVAKNREYEAQGVFDNGSIIVKKGSKIRKGFSAHIRGGTLARSYRNNPDYVNENGVTLKDCIFNSPSTAAQFVMGTSINGWKVWHVDEKTNLRQYIESLK